MLGPRSPWGACARFQRDPLTEAVASRSYSFHANRQPTKCFFTSIKYKCFTTSYLTPPVTFFSRGRDYEADGLQKTDSLPLSLSRAADRRGFDVLICSSPSTSEEGGGGGVWGGVGVIRWFQSWGDPGERNESLTLPPAGFHPDAEHA